MNAGSERERTPTRRAFLDPVPTRTWVPPSPSPPTPQEQHLVQVLSPWPGGRLARSPPIESPDEPGDPSGLGLQEETRAREGGEEEVPRGCGQSARSRGRATMSATTETARTSRATTAVSQTAASPTSSSSLRTSSSRRRPPASNTFTESWRASADPPAATATGGRDGPATALPGPGSRAAGRGSRLRVATRRGSRGLDGRSGRSGSRCR